MEPKMEKILTELDENMPIEDSLFLFWTLFNSYREISMFLSMSIIFFIL